MSRIYPDEEDIGGGGSRQRVLQVQGHGGMREFEAVAHSHQQPSFGPGE